MPIQPSSFYQNNLAEQLGKYTLSPQLAEMGVTGAETANAVAQALPGSPAGLGGLFSGVGKWMEDSGFLGRTLADGTKLQGWGGLALGAGQGLMNAFMGMQQYGLAKKTLEENKRQFQLNYDAQRTTTNSALEDRQRARLAANPGAYESLSTYMDKNRIK